MDDPHAPAQVVRRYSHGPDNLFDRGINPGKTINVIDDATYTATQPRYGEHGVMSDVKFAGFKSMRLMIGRGLHMVEQSPR